MTPKFEDDGHIVFVCMGNIHRSPLAEAMFKKKMSGRKHNCLIESAGVLDIGYQPAAAEWSTHKFGSHFDLSAHRSRHISAVKYTEKTFFVCVEETVRSAVLDLDGVSTERVLLLNAPNGVYDPRIIGYDGCFTQVHAGLAKLEMELGIDRM
jgi:protein-tyrosine-phosphatase